MILHFEHIPVLIRARLIPETLSGPLGPSIMDSRRIQPGGLFWALAGDQADGHAYVSDAFARGAGAAVVRETWHREHGAAFPGRAFVVVDDPLAALQDLAQAHRRRFTGPVIALTGSNGKTSTKELLAAALGSRHKLLKSAGNFNNHIGVPLTLLDLRPDHAMALIEMGTNHPGEIALLCRLAQPTAGLVTNVGPAHLEGLGDVEGVAREKGALPASLPPDGAVFVNLDDPRVRAMASPAGTRLGYGFSPALRDGGCDRIYRGENLRLTPRGRAAFTVDGMDFTLAWPGLHQAANALAAAAVADHFGVPLAATAQIFAALPPLPGRLQVLEAGGRTILDDTYNANPASTAAALDFLISLPVPGRRYAVLGDNLELGAASQSEHRGLGRKLTQSALDGVFLVGREMGFAAEEIARAGGRATHFGPEAPVADIVAAVARAVRPGDAVLIKASRGMGLDRVARGLAAGTETSDIHRS
ncbi:MAG: UDP-N-acetylmuramoyl-tripeptide--D-alanyl-D-alanine ligase [Candidatus Zixiibacteriota bacterium]|nr:MAG: UDP-N-acetylmuramoyl-tripeptide--D-alanyl-D-alanine ligase [candidate division Zixibacteria bacterium]